jgi:hypothetical protein
MPPRSFPAAVPDSSILALFTTSTTQLKAYRVLSLLSLPRSKIRNIASSLRRLARNGALIELPSSSAVRPHPIYMLPPTAPPHVHAGTTAAPNHGGLAESSHPQSIERLLDVDNEVEEMKVQTQPLCAVCRENWPTEVLLPCRHQSCCKECWGKCVDTERIIHNKRERLKYELGTRDLPRSLFLPRCPVCMMAVEEIISPYL